MSIQPVITFKAGKCDADLSFSEGPKVKPVATPGFAYLYYEDELVHFCWRARDAPLADAELDLTMVPTDGMFKPYYGSTGSATSKSPINGRIFVLKFSSSSQRYFFWLQSLAQPAGDPRHFSPRDLKLGEIVDNLLQGGEMDSSEIATLRQRRNGGDDGDDDDDDTMDDVQGNTHLPELHRQGSGGAGADATGGDVREEGADARDGGADGGRADPSAQDQIRNLLASINPTQTLQGDVATQQMSQNEPFTTLNELLPASTTVPMLSAAPSSFLTSILAHHLPPTLLHLEHGASTDDIPDTTAPGDEETNTALAEALSDEQKKTILARVLRSPQFGQALGSLTTALRDGGLPSVSDALELEVAQGGYLNRAAGVPMAGGNAVEAFIDGVKKNVKDSKEQGK